ncbi:YdeI family protein [archaeon]
MELGKTLYVVDRKAWRSWLAKNHKKENEIWLIYYRKASGKPRIAYIDAVEEAICYGWIDGIVKKVDETRFAQRFTPRRPGSAFSEMNKEHARRLIKKKRMTAAGLKTLPKGFGQSKEKLVIASDVLKELKADKQVWKNFQAFPDYYKRIRIAYIESQRRHGSEMFQKSLLNFIKMTAKNTRFGMLK